MELVRANVIFVYMRISSNFLFFVVLLGSPGAVCASSIPADTITEVVLVKAEWELVRSPATFEPAGWQSKNVLALTRVQAIKDGTDHQ